MHYACFPYIIDFEYGVLGDCLKPKVAMNSKKEIIITINKKATPKNNEVAFFNSLKLFNLL